MPSFLIMLGQLHQPISACRFCRCWPFSVITYGLVSLMAIFGPHMHIGLGRPVGKLCCLVGLGVMSVYYLLPSRPGGHVWLLPAA